MSETPALASAYQCDYCRLRFPGDEAVLRRHLDDTHPAATRGTLPEVVRNFTVCPVGADRLHATDQ